MLLEKIFSVKTEISNNYQFIIITILGIKIKHKTNFIYRTELQFNNQDKCLVIAPHPDDESIACGGMLLKYPNNFEVLILSDGRFGGELKDDFNSKKIAEQRLIELKNAMNYIGISKYKNLMIKDSNVKQNLDKLKEVNLKQYDYIFVPNANENHVDHNCILKKVKQILRWTTKTKIFSYEVWTPIINPDKQVNIDNVLEKKINLLKLYESQIKTFDYITMATSLNCFRGTYSVKSYAECYKTEKTFLQRLTKR